MNAKPIPFFAQLEPRLLLSAVPLPECLILSGVEELLGISVAGDMSVLSADDGLNVFARSSKPKPTRTPADIGNTFDTAADLGLDDAGSGKLSSTIGYAADVDVLSVVATQSGQMQIDLIPVVNKKNKLNGDLSAYDSATVLIVSDADGADAAASVAVDVVGGQTYFIRIAGTDGMTGRYTIRIATTVAPDPTPPPDDPDPTPPPDDPDPTPPPDDPDPTPPPDDPDPTPPPDDPDPTPPPPGEYVPGSEVTWFTETLEAGLGLVVLGTDGADAITVSRSGGYTVIITAAGTYNLAETFAGVQLYGFGGDDMLVTISGVSESVWGGGGFDSFWTDSLDVIGDVEAAEAAGNSVHVVTEFYQPTSDPAEYVSMELAGQDIVDPAANGYVDFSDKPLFVDGPDYNDIIQGSIGDCYFLAVLSSLADSDPVVIEQMIAPMGDGTFAVRFHRGSAEVYLRIDAQLPVYYSECLKYAKLTPDGELWVALAEKAYAQFRTGENSYASLSGGWMGTVYTEVTNLQSDYASVSSLSDNALVQFISDNLEDGHAISAGSATSATNPIAGNHAYMVESIEYVGGQWYVTVYNPWGNDGYLWDSNYNDGVLTISLDMFQQNFSALSVSTA